MIGPENIDELLQEVRTLVGNGKIAQAMEKLQQTAKAADLEREFIHLSHSYSELKSKEIRGTLDRNELSIENAKLIEQILDLCSLIKSKSKNSVSERTKLPKIVVPLLIVVILSLIGIYYASYRGQQKSLLDRAGEVDISEGTFVDTFSIRFPISANAVRFGRPNPLYRKADLAARQYQGEQSNASIPDIDILPNLSSIEYFKLGITYRQSNMLNKALAYFNRSILENNTFVNAYLERGITHRILGQYEEALNDYSEAIAIDASIAQTYVNRSVVYFMLEKYDLAQEDCIKAFQIDSLLPELHLSMGNVYLGKEMYEESRAAFERALALRPFYANAIYGLSFAYYSLGDLQRYCDLVEEYRKLEGSTFVAQYAMICGSGKKI